MRRLLPTVALASLALVWTSSSQAMAQIPSWTSSDRRITATGDARQPAISPDGRKVGYLARAENGATALMVQDLAGREEALEIARVGNRSLPLRWSLRGSELYTWGGPPEFRGALVRFPEGSIRFVASTGPLGAFLPDAERLITAWQYSDTLYVLHLETGERTVIALPDSFDWIDGLDVSPDGRWIALLTQSQPIRRNLWIVQTDGSRFRRLLEARDRGVRTGPRWSANSDGIYYTRGGELLRIAVSPVSGEAIGPPQRILSRGFIMGFDLSRDGRRLVYGAGLASTELTLHAPSESGSPLVTSLSTGDLMAMDASVSPDGREMVFVGGKDSRESLYRMSLDGGPVTQLVSFPDAGLLSPVWSPDGRDLAFVLMQGERTEIWRIPAAGGTARPMSGTEGAIEIRWAPGANILIQRQSKLVFRLLDPETGQERLLVEDESGQMAHPRYSPNGSKVAIHRLRGSPGLYVIDIESGQTIQLTDGWELPVGWSPEGDAVYARLLDPGTIVRIPLEGRPAEVFTVLCGDPHPAGVEMLPDGRRFLCSGYRTHVDLWLIEDVDRLVGQVSNEP
jgi:Tol biopolymer transport system component